MNRVTLYGRLGADPELRHNKNGTAYVALRIATNRRVKDRDAPQGWVEVTDWHRVMVWGRTAETVAEHCVKGRSLLIEGTLQTREYEEDGIDPQTGQVVKVTRYITEVHARQVIFGDRRG